MAVERRIFQDRNRLDIAGIERTQYVETRPTAGAIVLERNAVNNVQRLVIALNRVASPNTDACCAAGCARVLGDLYPGRPALQRLIERGYGYFTNFFNGYRCHRTRQIAFLDLPIADHHHFVQRFGIRHQLYVNVDRLRTQLLADVANETEHQRSAGPSLRSFGALS